ncbi:MAG: hypothetical protein KIT84_16395 [Labilithrix sp.]|nr:hypothetical protein [Labilithrix sp.]MCW5812610.1 hypothetical protein [Labilithrix sp.]
MLDIPLGRVTAERLADASMEAQLPYDASVPPRRASLNAQFRAELRCALGALDQALEALRVSTEQGLIDVLWLERCPLLDPIRPRPEFQQLSSRVTDRAQRVSATIATRFTRADF